MPMQPRPIGDVVGPLEPSVRVFNAILLSWRWRISSVSHRLTYFNTCQAAEKQSLGDAAAASSEGEER